MQTLLRRRVVGLQRHKVQQLFPMMAACTHETTRIAPKKSTLYNAPLQRRVERDASRPIVDVRRRCSARPRRSVARRRVAAASHSSSSLSSSSCRQRAAAAAWRRCSARLRSPIRRRARSRALRSAHRLPCSTTTPAPTSFRADRARRRVSTIARRANNHKNNVITFYNSFRTKNKR